MYEEMLKVADGAIEVSYEGVSASDFCQCQNSNFQPFLPSSRKMLG
jgi:hypothetical protein